MKWHVRMVAALILFGLTGLCIFGLVGSFKPQFQGNWGIRLVCVFTGSACLLGAVFLLQPGKKAG